MLGISSRALFNSSSTAFCSDSNVEIDVLASATLAISSATRVSSFAFFASPISFDAELRVACQLSCPRIIARRLASIDIRCCDNGSSPRRFRPLSKASGCSRIHLMSYMAALLARHAALESPRATLLRRLGGGIVRRRRGGGRRLLGILGGFLGLRLLLNHFHRPDRALVQQHQRDRERHLAEHVGRRQDGGQNEGTDDEIAPLLPELLRRDQPDAP